MYFYVGNAQPGSYYWPRGKKIEGDVTSPHVKMDSDMPECRIDIVSLHHEICKKGLLKK